ncbi:tetratricopeptide repeat protein [Candidatus Woesearchaeota archaeon]|nr:tetratricopeptide repeat protein [Candidatus Woesearchaeota archaeon]
MKKTTVIILGLMIVVLLAGVALGTGMVFKTDNPDFQDDPAFYKNLGNELVRRGNPEGAIGAYEKSLELGEDENIRSNLAILYYQAGAYSDAASHLRVLVALAPEDPSYHYDLAVNLVDRFRNTEDKRLEDLFEALREYELVAEMSPDFGNAQGNVAALKEVLKVD